MNVTGPEDLALGPHVEEKDGNFDDRDPAFAYAILCMTWCLGIHKKILEIKN